MIRSVFDIIAICAVLPTVLIAEDISCDPLGTQAQMTVCANENFLMADADLKAAYQTAMVIATERGHETDLRDAQQLWIGYRDAACRSEAEMLAGGALEPFIYASCLMRLTDVRTKDLNFFAGL